MKLVYFAFDEEVGERFEYEFTITDIYWNLFSNPDEDENEYEDRLAIFISVENTS